MTTGRPGVAAAPNAAYAGQVVQFPDPVRAERHPAGVRVDEHGHPDFGPYAAAAAEVADPPAGFGVDELRLTDYVSANAALFTQGHPLWADLDTAVATPPGWTWHHVAGRAAPGWRRMELVPVEVKAMLRHHGGLATSSADHGRRGTRPLQEKRAVHFPLALDGSDPIGVPEDLVQRAEQRLGYRLPGAYRTFLKLGGGRVPAGVALDPDLGLLVDQPFLTLTEEYGTEDVVYANKCLRDHFTKDYLGIAYAQGGILALKVRGDRIGSVWLCLYDDARDTGAPEPPEDRVERLLLPCGDDFDAFLLRLAGSPPELETVAELMVNGGFARAVPVG
ncbi:SMI1/KNR4 family protein [Kitasatospora purpeofusca]|uniref:SMI1/KNR4 family protein n=1 Tax=Kitasatospora purpeofusca TaxID=67352 RepID=UPI00224D8EC0|nr:SMI1/KNR4 family protein [Kitasatospora purpeofusca]MCX4754580.1 SMI1/KNR4 family protein [Kitasatospora purpeofusca]WSR33991.1 SMI1/KNR4 family protein [Kitasatospora purpeofusca]WSR42207.1 SMI1/KNR4 family protein [Kitasatospora purpeofusca]